MMRNNLQFVKETKVSKRNIFLGIGIVAILFGICFVNVFQSSAKPSDQTEKVYVYDVIQQKLADEVKDYLKQYFTLPEQTFDEVANVAVQNYNTVMESDTDVINDEITQAVEQRMKSAMVALINDVEFDDETLDALASGMTQIIWSTVLDRLSSNKFVITEDFKDDYDTLTSSLQTQISELKKRQMKVTINARVLDNTEATITADSLLAGIEQMSESELKELAEKMGISVDDINNSVNEVETQTKTLIEQSSKTLASDVNSKINNKIDKEMNEINKEINELDKEMHKKIDEKTKNIKDGTDGKDGVDGKTTYIAYADDIYGTNFSFTPTETSKYIGTCISQEKTQPTDFLLYDNWQEYRQHIITSTKDPETGVTTVHIN